MASYKVLQDIEAEDTLVGPLTLRQCIYAAIAILAGYLSFIAISKGAAFLVIFLLPFIAFGMFFAFPWSKQQSTEVWALAKVRFYFKPRKRIWNQSGVKELVTITVPKNIKKAYASSLSPGEVKSRLKALADTIDSRGWAVKNVDLGYYNHATLAGQGTSSDRLLDASSFPQEVPTVDPTEMSDMFDVQNNPVAQKFDAMMSQAADFHRQQLQQQMAQPVSAPMQLQNPGAPNGQGADPNYWHLRTIAPIPAQPVQGSAPTAQPSTQYVQPMQSSQTTQSTQRVASATQPTAGQSAATTVPYAAAASPPTAAYDMTLPTPIDPGSSYGYSAPITASPSYQTAQMAATQTTDYAGLQRSAYQPEVAQPTAQFASPMQPATSPGTAVTPHANPAILELANNNDLNIATLAREAQARSAEPPDEVVVAFN